MRIALRSLAGALACACAAQAQDGADLLRKKGCGRCHALASSKDEISLKEIAAKYRGRRDASAALAAGFPATPRITRGCASPTPS